MAVLGAVAFFVCKKLKNEDIQKTKRESKKDEEKKIEELPNNGILNSGDHFIEEKVVGRDNNPDEF